MDSIARSAGSANPLSLIPGLTPRALCCRALRALTNWSKKEEPPAHIRDHFTAANFQHNFRAKAEASSSLQPADFLSLQSLAKARVRMPRRRYRLRRQNFEISATVAG